MSNAKPDTKPDTKPVARDVKAERKEKATKKGMQGVARYFVETKAELKKIVWPTPKKVINNTGVVLFFMLVVGAFIWCLDALTSLGFNWVVTLIK